MTRGTFILICEDTVLESLEFNGNMFLDDEGFGAEAVIMLSQVEVPEEFEGMVSEFNRRHHKYDDQLVYQHDDFYDGEDVVDFRVQYFERFFSDYLYIKNLRNVPVKVTADNGKHYAILPGKVVVVNFGRCILDTIVQEAVEKYSQKFHFSA